MSAKNDTSKIPLEGVFNRMFKKSRDMAIITDWLHTTIQTCQAGDTRNGAGDLAKFMLDFGRAMDRSRHMPGGPSGACWANAIAMALDRPEEFAYVEGWAVADGDGLPLPQSHGWLMDRTGAVVEITWEKPGSAYYGIALTHAWVQENRRPNGAPLLEMSEGIYRLVTDAPGERERALLKRDDWISKEVVRVEVEEGEDPVDVTLFADGRAHFKCPGCRMSSSLDQPKCYFEQGGACERHDVCDAIRGLQRRREKAAGENLDGAGI